MFKNENILCQGKENRMSWLLYYTQLAIILKQKQRIWDRNLARNIQDKYSPKVEPETTGTSKETQEKHPPETNEWVKQINKKDMNENEMDNCRSIEFIDR